MVGPIKGGQSVKCQGKLFCNVECRLKNASVELRYVLSVGCQPVFECRMSGNFKGQCRMSD